MSRLDEILDIVDRRERETALCRYAQSLNLNTFKAQTKNDRYNEEKLVLMIHDALRDQKISKSKNLKFAAVSLILAGSVTALFFSLPRLVQAIYEDNFSEAEPAANVMRAYGPNGAPLTQNNQPVLLEAMQGEYIEYDDQGRPTVQNFYKNGQLLWTKKLDANGKVISVKEFPQQ